MPFRAILKKFAALGNLGLRPAFRPAEPSGKRGRGL